MIPRKQSELIPAAVGVVSGVLSDGRLQMEHQDVIVQNLINQSFISKSVMNSRLQC